MLSLETTILLFLTLLYAPASIVSLRFLLPHLAGSAKRLALFMLAAQLLAILLALTLRTASGFEQWLWHLDVDGNITSALASAQLALVAIVALLTAWHSRGSPRWQRIYFVGIALAFYYLARDEFFALHEQFVG